jgi:flagellar protein FlaJ
MIGKKISWTAFISLLTVIAISIVARIIDLPTISVLLLSSALGVFLIFSWIQRKVKEDMLSLITEDFKENEWKYFLTSILAFIFLIFASLINAFIIFFGLPMDPVLINIFLGTVIVLMLYTVLSIPTVEETRGYLFFFFLSFAFTCVVIGAQLDIGFHLPEDIAPIIRNLANPLFLLNLALIFEMTSLMAGGEMPSPTASVIGIYERSKFREERPTIMRRNIIYLTIIIFIILFVFVNVATIIPFPGGISLSGISWSYAIIFISMGLLIGLILYIILIMPEKAGMIREKYDINVLYRILVLATSATFAAVFVAIGILLQMKIITGIGPISLSPENSIDFAVFAILVSIGPVGFYEYACFRKMDLMEERFPEFLRDLSESRKAGMTMARAVETAAKGDYGYLTPEVKKMAVQISWGVTFTEALRRFGERIKTPLVQRSTTMVVKASEAGGKISDVIEAAAKNVREIKILQADRKTEMKMYLMIIYVAFFVFLAVIAILTGTFIPKLIESTQSAEGGIGGISTGGTSLNEYEFVYICTALVQAIGNGVVSGVLGEGRISSGLRHATIMALITYIVFKLII